MSKNTLTLSIYYWVIMADTELVKEKYTEHTELTIKNQQSRYHRLIPQSVCLWLEHVLGVYGYFCATHAWEAICTIVTFTLCVVSSSLVRSIPREVQRADTEPEVEEVTI